MRIREEETIMNAKNNSRNAPEGVAAMPAADGYGTVLGFAPGGADASPEGGRIR